MKVNEAPEKIYIFENPISGTPDDRWLSKRSDDEDIEYTRTDAFIEKACEFIETYPHLFMGVLRSEVIEDFKNYMKGGKV